MSINLAEAAVSRTREVEAGSDRWEGIGLVPLTAPGVAFLLINRLDVAQQPAFAVPLSGSGADAVAFQPLLLVVVGRAARGDKTGVPLR